MYEIDLYLQELGEKVISEKEDVEHLVDCRIKYLMSDKKKMSNRKVVYADCEKVKDKFKALIGVDFIITFYEPNIDGLSQEQMEILMWHELKHIGFENDKCFIIPHDIEDFANIIEQYGIDWNRRAE